MNLLIIDDEQNIRKTVALYLKSAGHSCQTAGSAGEALKLNQSQEFDIAFLDLRLGVENGLDLIKPLLAGSPSLKIVVMTAYSSVDTAVEAMKQGAFDYISKPFDPAAIELILNKVKKMKQMENKLSALKSDLRSIHPDGVFDSRNSGMQKTLELARQVADSDCIVLIRGESGTGKTVLAKALHQWSSRRDSAFGVISCPSLSGELLASELFGHVKGAFTGAVSDHTGRIASCDHGTVFLDEIGDLPLGIQPQLLRFIQDKEYESVGSTVTRRADVRIIAATNLDLETAVREKRFREDLFFRLNVFQLTLPPLRERPEDILPLAGCMLRFFAESNHKNIGRFSPEAEKALQQYQWPGNLRELRNAVERAVILTARDEVQLDVLPESVYRPAREKTGFVGESLEELEKYHIQKIIERSASLQEAADKLGIDQTTLWRKRKQYGL